MFAVDAAAQPLGRWRTFADAVALALGINLWVSLVLLPGMVSGALSSGGAQMAALLPVAVLAFGVWKRSEIVLLFGVPATLLVPVAFAPEMANVHVYGPIRFALVAAGMVGYLFGASIFTSFREPPPPLSRRPLGSAAKPVPERWKRRFRVYNGLAILSAAYPLVLLYTINFDQTTRAFMANRFPERVAALSALLNLGAIAFWVLLFVVFFLGVLRPHRTGDRDMLGELEALRRQIKKGRPRPHFYVGVVVALVLMFILLVTRS